MENEHAKYVLAFDTSNEAIAIGVGLLDAAAKTVEALAGERHAARRASNTQLLPRIDALLKRLSVARGDIACVCVGRGPGSFTGVRIAMATAKGIASALPACLVGISTQEAVAWEAHAAGVRGRLLVAGDAMRKEIYPSYFELDDAGVRRLSPDKVAKAADFVEQWEHPGCPLTIAGDALGKYGDELGRLGTVAPEALWTPTGQGLLQALQAAWRAGAADPLDSVASDPVGVLPIYTRLSDAEEHERARLATPGERNLVTGVQGDASAVGAVAFTPFDAAYLAQAARLEAGAMGTDAWSEALIADELPRKDRTWWMAVRDGVLIGYAGGLVCAGEVQLLKVAVRPDARRQGVARELVCRVAYDAESLAASSMSLEVRASNEGAIAFYESLGLGAQGRRPKYYSDREDAVVMAAPLPLACREGGCAPDAQAAPAQGGRALADEAARPLILAIESSCDETAASVVDGEGRILSDVVSSQVDFHARFGGVVPEIASRKHVEAIVGVTRLALEEAAASLGADALGWHDLDAVGVTYAPGLVGALVVGVAFAKGAAWAADVPLVRVNHLEGHLYANKLADDFQPPAVVSLVSGGNTMLVHMRDWQDYEVLGATIDDAVGEAFDKVAKALGLPYPGGPHISRLAAEGDPAAIDFPRALMHSGDYRFSLSGLKTAVMTYIAKQRESGEGLNVPDVCASFQQAVVDVQVSKAARALQETGAGTFCLGGGVAANPELRRAYEKMCGREGVRLAMPPLSACGDNAAMIALVALDRYRGGAFAGLDQDAFAHADLQEPY